jgi:adenylate kinase
MEKMIIIMLGAPGAGKGTQAERLEEELRMVHVSSGELLRDNIKRGTELGRLAEPYMGPSGGLVPDELVIDMILDRMEAPDVERGIILDGFPRTLPQAQALDEALEQKGRRVNSVLYIRVDNETLLDRLSGRWTCRNCGHVYHEKFSPPKIPGLCDLCGGELYQRVDDARETAVKRLQTYFELTMPLVHYYRDRHLLCEINGDQPVEKVTRDLLNCLR